MTEDVPKGTAGGLSDKTKARLDREAAALRANLARRKAQKRGQAAPSRKEQPEGTKPNRPG